MKNTRLKSTIVLAMGCLMGYVAACSNPKPERDTDAVEQQAVAEAQDQKE